MNPVNFKANYLRTAYIPKKTVGGEYEPAEVSIVEINPKDKNDVDALAKTAFEWDKKAYGYATDIYLDCLNENIPYSSVAERYLAVTKQNQDYEKLESDKILGLALFSEKKGDSDEITWFQVNPQTNAVNPKINREFLNVGKCLSDFIKSITDKPIRVLSDRDAISFYLKQGFVPFDQSRPLQRNTCAELYFPNGN